MLCVHTNILSSKSLISTACVESTGMEISCKAVKKRGIFYQLLKPVFQALIFFVRYER